MQTNQRKIDISIREQLLRLKEGRKTLRQFPISSSRFGLGTKEGSNKTPLGKFRIAEKIGAGKAAGTIFKSRVPLGPNDPLPQTDDFITSRIMWLDGLGKRNANTHARFVYIHGTKHENTIGTPDSHGCIRMRNADVIELFDLVEEGTPVTIRK
jgi:lipoprotein-anchoring transpeptidase ErfK/SrfK